MTQAYAARSTPSYWAWIGGAALLLAVAAVAWTTFGRQPQPVPPTKGLPVQVVTHFPARPSAAVTNAVPEPSQPAPAPPALTSESSDEELLARIGDLEGKLAAEHGRVEQYRQGLLSLSTEYSSVVAQNERYRDAIQAALHAPATPVEPKKVYVSHLGQPYVVPVGWDSFTVSGEFYSAESTSLRGKATIDLYLAGLKADSTSFELSLPPHSSVPYQVSFTPRKTYMTSGAVVAAVPRWAPLE